MKRPTSQDVALLAGVSRAVVSAILNRTPGIRVSPEKRQAVMDAIAQLGYRVDAQARGMRTGRSRTIAAYGNLDNPMFLQVLQGAQQTCMQAGYHLLLYGKGGHPGEKEELLALYQERRIDGLLTKDATGFADEAFAAMVHEAGLPFVSVEGYPESEQVQSVLMDYGESIRMALDYMWRQTGLSPIYIAAYESDTVKWGDRHRLEAYERWMAEHGSPPRIFRLNVAEPEALRELLAELPGPAAVLCNWFAASNMVYRAAAGLGLAVGRDLFIMSADNTAQANRYMVPSLSSIEVPYVKMGAAAAERVIRLAEGKEPEDVPAKIWIPPQLAPGESV
ncbi:MAG: LacI family transcriptional regulator [Paenibacillaceae bacterium]|jgi:LacI family transcriptional regulator|nr:LacI family transcriptional regulator [Paenibacillaceae bacterium]